MFSMTVDTLVAIAQLCHYSIAPGAVGDLYDKFSPYDNSKGQLVCQKYLIKCVRDNGSHKVDKAEVLADCITNMEWK